MVSYQGDYMCFLKTADLFCFPGIEVFRLISLAGFFPAMSREVEERRTTPLPPTPFPQNLLIINKNRFAFSHGDILEHSLCRGLA